MAVAAVIAGIIIFNGLTLFLEKFYSLLQKKQKKSHVMQLMWSLGVKRIKQA